MPTSSTSTHFLISSIIAGGVLLGLSVGIATTHLRRCLRRADQFHRVTFLPENHLGLTTSPTFTNNILYQLLVEPR